MSISNRAVLACLVIAASSQVHADGIGSAIGGASGIGRGVGDQSGIIIPAKLNRIALSSTSILAGSVNGTVLGTASLGAEFLEQTPGLDAVVIAVGGGGLLAGAAAAMKQASPQLAVYGVEPAGADSLSRSFAVGKPVTLERVSTIADSLAPPMATPYTFEVCRRFVDSLVVVDDEAMRRTMGIMFRDLKLAVEPAGAAALAGVLGPLRAQLSGGRRVGVVVCGSNIDLETFYRYAHI